MISLKVTNEITEDQINRYLNSTQKNMNSLVERIQKDQIDDWGSNEVLEKPYKFDKE